MVGDNAQIFTIEGVAAAVLLLATAYIIINSTSILTPGDTHISDMQLQQLGDDVLRIMDTPLTYNNSANTMYGKKISDLELNIQNYSAFKKEFFVYAGYNDTSTPLSLHIKAILYHPDGSPDSSFLDTNPYPQTGREHIVTVTRLVNLNDSVDLLEVHLWRD